jgi:excisionase family DNA binding protein
MGDSGKENPEYLKIGDAAKFLGVNRRTIYRRVWSGEIPAARVGGLYFIRKSDLEAMLSKGIPISEETQVPEPAQIKCGACYRLLTSDQMMGEVCAFEGCDEMVCTRCLEEGTHYCTRHTPGRKDRLELARQKLQRGEIQILVPAAAARLRELNFINRVEARICSIASVIHPQSGEAIQVKDWQEIMEHGDERAEVMRLLNRVVLHNDALAQSPFNVWLIGRPPLPRNSRAIPIEIQVRALSRLGQMVREGYDDSALGTAELAPWLEKLSNEAQQEDVFHMILLASVTGWNAEARQVIHGKPDAALGSAFIHRQVLFYLFDIEKGELIYHDQDERARRYAEFFVPTLPSEEVEETIRAVEREFLVYESLTLQYAGQVLSFPEMQLKLAFERLAATGRYALTDVPKLGLTLVRNA